MLRPLLAWLAAAAASAVLGASLFVGLTLVHGPYDLGFAAQLWVWLVVAGAVIALLPGGLAALIAVGLANILKPPRPLADMVAGALGALAILLGVRTFVFARFEEAFSWPAAHVVLAIPLLAGALAGYVYWRVATTTSVSAKSAPLNSEADPRSTASA